MTLPTSPTLSTDNQARRIGPSWLAALITIGGVLGYLAAYDHELGYFACFKIPPAFIQLDWGIIFPSIVVTIVGLLIFVWCFGLLFLNRSTQIGPIKRRLYFIFIVFIAVFIYTLIHLTTQQALHSIGLVVVTGILFFVLPWFGSQGSYRERLQSFDNKLAQRPASRWSRPLELSLVFIYAAFFIYVLSFQGGFSDAMNTRTYYIPSSAPNAVVLKFYQHDAICANLVSIDEISQDYFIINLEQQPEVTFKKLDVNQMRVQTP